MWKAVQLVSVLAMTFCLHAQDQGKPVVPIAGNGNISINAIAQGIGGVNGGVGWTAGSSKATVNKREFSASMRDAV
jgi:hypothetical protein